MPFIPLDKKLLKHRQVMPNGCWEWKALRLPAGYGIVGSRTKKLLAHRISWEVNRGPIPKGLHVLHRCDNPPCFNPDHLFLGTPSDNLKDCWAKGRHPWSKGGYGSSGVRGVIRVPKGWRAQIYRPVEVYVGTFRTLEEAKAAVESYRAEHNLP